MPRPLHLVVTDSGIGGLSACAAIERALREGAGASVAGGPGRRAAHAGSARITYVNAWPSEQGGYNDLPDIEARAEVFDRALGRMAALEPDLIVIACNTLSVVYAFTTYSQRLSASPAAAPRLPPALGIVQAGVQLFLGAIGSDAASTIVLLGTKTTIESGVHRRELIERGVDSARIVAEPCHGLAKSIETEMEGPSTVALIDECARRAARSLAERSNGAVWLGLCCTHYSYVRDRLQSALERHSGRTVAVLDPTDRLVWEALASEGPCGDRTSDDRLAGSATGPVSLSVVSKVRMDEGVRRTIAARLASVSPATAQALMSYTHVPDLF